MITNDKGIVELKHFILREVCRLAWEDKLDAEGTEKILYEVSPGPKPKYRCCIYKEREIVRGRIRLAMGLSPEVNRPTDNVVAVIPAACDDCPIQDYFVSDICRFCLGKACLNACRFDAIAPGDSKMKIDPAKCKSCGMCAKACPYGAIIHQERPCKKACPVGAISYDEAGVCRIDENKCVHCGHCIHNCPFGAIGSKIYAVDVIRAICSGKRVIAMCAPATEGQFGKIQFLRGSHYQEGPDADRVRGHGGGRPGRGYDRRLRSRGMDRGEEGRPEDDHFLLPGVHFHAPAPFPGGL